MANLCRISADKSLFQQARSMHQTWRIDWGCVTRRMGSTHAMRSFLSALKAHFQWDASRDFRRSPRMQCGFNFAESHVLEIFSQTHWTSFDKLGCAGAFARGLRLSELLIGMHFVFLLILGLQGLWMLDTLGSKFCVWKISVFDFWCRGHTKALLFTVLFSSSHCRHGAEETFASTSTLVEKDFFSCFETRKA